MRTSQLSKYRAALACLGDRTVLNTLRVAIQGGYPYRSWDNGGWHAEQAAADCLKLRALNMFPDGLHERINKRAALIAYIQKCERGGLIGIVESGRDCDCVDYVHPKGTIPATWAAYMVLERHTAQWADGPFSLGIVPPEVEAQTQYESHDRVLEAFENGHPHHVISTFHG